MTRYEIFPGVWVEIDESRYIVRSALNVTPQTMPDEFIITLDLRLTDTLEGTENKTQGIVVVRSKV